MTEMQNFDKENIRTKIMRNHTFRIMVNKVSKNHYLKVEIEILEVQNLENFIKPKPCVRQFIVSNESVEI